MKILLIPTIIVALFVGGCGSAQPEPAEPAVPPTSKTETSGSTPSNISAPPPAEAGGLPPENAAGTAIKAGELGPQ
jgi:PBP1b-binding outer membrane lipoprotein LpoB